MKTRKEMKRAARKSLKKHYLMFVAICLIAAFLGSEFSSSLDAVKSYSQEREIADNPGTGLTTGSSAGLIDVIEEAIMGNEEASRDLSQRIQEERIEQSQEEDGPMGRSRGHLAKAVNGITSGTLLVGLLSTVNSVIGSSNVTFAILAIFAALLILSTWFFFCNIYIVVARRMFLEGRCYESVPIDRFLFLIRVKKWIKVSATMFVEFFYLCLWSLTIIGGIIKVYSYYMVPYIIAENPDLSPNQAITLSRRMMQGHKWECFIFEWSYAGWFLLGIVTFGLSAILYSNPYQVAAFCEYYAELRKEAKAKNLPGAELLNDAYLFDPPSRSVIDATYQDVIAIMERPDEDIAYPGKVRRSLANCFGVVFTNNPQEQAYEQHEADKIRIKKLTDDVEGKSYPGRLFPIPETEKRSRLESLYYMRRYSIWSLIMMFFLFSFIGWIWEVSLHLIQGDGFVNRGVMYGPWLPIYGAGGILILTLLYKVRNRPALAFGCAILLCGVIEYFTSYFLEMLHDEVWWDYSGYFLNLNGRICAEGLLIFGLGGMFVVYTLAPLIDNFVKRIRLRRLIPISVLLIGLFLADQIYSFQHPNTGKGITDYDKNALIRQNIDQYAKDKWHMM